MNGNADNDHSVRSRGTTQMQVRELIEKIMAFHADTAIVYARSRETTQAEEARMLLTHLMAHESILHNKLAEYASTAKPEVLDTWIKYTPEVSVETFLEKLRSIPHETTEQIAELAATISDTVIEMYDSVVEGSAAENVHEALQDLRDMELTEKIAALRSAEKQ